MISFSLKTISCLALFIFFPAAAGADTVLHNANGYTSTATGLQRFSTMVFGADGRIVAVGDAALRADRHPASAIDGHAGWANSAVLRIAGIDDRTTDPSDRKQVFDATPEEAQQ